MSKRLLIYNQGVTVTMPYAEQEPGGAYLTEAEQPKKNQRRARELHCRVQYAAASQPSQPRPGPRRRRRARASASLPVFCSLVVWSRLSGPRHLAHWHVPALTPTASPTLSVGRRVAPPLRPRPRGSRVRPRHGHGRENHP